MFGFYGFMLSNDLVHCMRSELRVVGDIELMALVFSLAFWTCICSCLFITFDLTTRHVSEWSQAIVTDAHKNMTKKINELS